MVQCFGAHDWRPMGLGFESCMVVPLRNLAIPFTPLCQCFFGGDTESRRSLLSGVYARGSKRSHTGGKGVTCRGLGLSTLK